MLGQDRHGLGRQARVELLGADGKDEEAGAQEAVQRCGVAGRERGEAADRLVAVLAGAGRLLVGPKAQRAVAQRALEPVQHGGLLPVAAEPHELGPRPARGPARIGHERGHGLAEPVALDRGELAPVLGRGGVQDRAGIVQVQVEQGQEQAAERRAQHRGPAEGGEQRQGEPDRREPGGEPRQDAAELAEPVGQEEAVTQPGQERQAHEQERPAPGSVRRPLVERPAEQPAAQEREREREEEGGVGRPAEPVDPGQPVEQEREDRCVAADRVEPGAGGEQEEKAALAVDEPPAEQTVAEQKGERQGAQIEIIGRPVGPVAAGPARVGRAPVAGAAAERAEKVGGQHGQEVDRRERAGERLLERYRRAVADGRELQGQQHRHEQQGGGGGERHGERRQPAAQPGAGPLGGEPFVQHEAGERPAAEHRQERRQHAAQPVPAGDLEPSEHGEPGQEQVEQLDAVDRGHRRRSTSQASAANRGWKISDWGSATSGKPPHTNGFQNADWPPCQASDRKRTVG